MAILFDEFDATLGMGCLTTHDAIVNSKLKKISLRTPNGVEVNFIGEKLKCPSNIILTLLARKYLKKGYEAYLASIIDIKVSESNLEEVLTISLYSDVFLEELPKVPPDRMVEFVIEMASSTTPISIAPYHMAPIKLKELKVQLQ